MSIRFSRLAVAVLVMSLSGVAVAGKPTNVTDAEMSLLPQYCPDTYGFKYGDAYYNTSPNAPKWVALMGKGFWAMHHYCWALINLNRAQKPSVPASVRQATREYAVDDMRYVIENTTADFVLLPEIYSRAGETLLDLKRVAEAQDAFDRARSLKPDYWPPYYHWGDYLRQNGKIAEARQVVEQGLSYSPDAKPLRTLFTLLGGDPSTVQPKSLPAKTANTPEPSNVN